MDDWKVDSLDELTLLVKDGTHGTFNDVRDGIPLLSAKDVEEGEIHIPDDCRKISLASYNAIHKTYELEDNDVLLTIVGTIGRAAIYKNVERKIAFQRSVAIIRPNQNKLLSDYLYLYTQANNFQSQLEFSKNASAQGGVYLGSLNKIRIKYPVSIAEQAKIAKIILTIDCLIKETQNLIAKYRCIKQGLMQDLFRYGIDENGQMRSHRTHRFKDSPLGRIPFEWEVKGLFDVCDLINGRAFKPTEWSDTGLPIIRIENLNNETAAFNYCNFQVQYKYMVESGDLLISWSGTPGTSFGIFEWLRGRAVLNQHIFRVVLSRGINKSYFYYAYGNLLDEMIKQSHGGVGLQHITRRDLRQFKLLLMGEKEQAEIANRLSAVDGLIAEETELHAKLKLLRNGLMRDLLSGKVRVSALMN